MGATLAAIPLRQRAGALQSGPMDQDTADEELMLRYAAGDVTAFELLYARHRGGLYAFVARQSPVAAWVDDIYQDAWLAVTRSRTDYRPSAAFRTWLYQIARNRLIDLVRQHQPARLARYLADEDDDPAASLPDPAPGPDAVAERQQRKAALEQALATLPPAQREAFLLREHAELSVDDIAAMTGVTPETAKSRLRYALNKLKTALAGRV